MPLDNSQGLAYGADQSSYGVVDSSQHYYQVLPNLFKGRICCLAAFDTLFFCCLSCLTGSVFILAQETALTQMQPSVPGSPYGDNYQQPFGTSYGSRGYVAPAPYQPATQPHMFLPSQAPQVPQVFYVY